MSLPQGRPAMIRDREFVGIELRSRFRDPLKERLPLLDWFTSPMWSSPSGNGWRNNHKNSIAGTSQMRVANVRSCV